ncbi:MAG: hypothetical protein E7399_09875 [Ruminococcaceae bacterium]|nr:hypothetical protein [Oscillospiraceae bacterium]
MYNDRTTKSNSGLRPVRIADFFVSIVFYGRDDRQNKRPSGNNASRLFAVVESCSPSFWWVNTKQTGGIMPNVLSQFDFHTNTIRTIIENGQIWFVANDILKALEYSEHSKPSKVLGHIPSEWIRVKPFHTLGGSQNHLIISEQGLYFLLGRSDKPKALSFQKWLAGEVLPSIRKTGSYQLNGKPEDVIRQVVGNRRFMLRFNHDGHLHVKLIDYDVFIGNVRNFIDYINDPECMESDDVISDLAKACINRLHRKIKNSQISKTV